MDQYPSSVDVERELVVIDDELRRLQERKALLLKYRELAAMVISNRKTPNMDPHSNPENRNGHGKINLELVQNILSEFGSLSVHMIVLKMRETGWHGSDRESLDWDRINKMLQRHNDIFERQSRGLWGLRSTSTP